MRIYYPQTEVGVVAPQLEQPPAQLERIVQREPISFADDELLKAFGTYEPNTLDNAFGSTIPSKVKTNPPSVVSLCKNGVTELRTEVDDLKRIVGIGSCFEGKLLKAGITSFYDLATTSADSLDRIIQSPYPNYEHWIEQASNLFRSKIPAAPKPAVTEPSTEMLPVSSENIKILDLLKIASLDVIEVEVRYEDFDNAENCLVGIAVIDKFNGITSIFLDEIICLSSDNEVSIKTLQPYDTKGQYFIHGIEYVDDQSNRRTLASDKISKNTISWYLVE